MKYVFLIDPVPASRPRVPRFGKPYYLPTYENFRQKMKLCMDQIEKTLLDCPLSSEVTFFKQIPKSYSKKMQERLDGKYCISNVDLDNLEKALYDAMNEHVYLDDKQIVVHHTSKRWTKENPRIEVRLTPVQL